MAIRIYIMPIESATVGGGVYRGPKYFRSRNRLAPDAELQSVSYGAMPFGHEPSCMVAADVTDEQHTILSGKVDVLSIPANLDNNLTAGAVTAAQDFLETVKIPANWITTDYTYRQVLRMVGGMCQYMQAVKGRTTRWLNTVSLNDTFASLPANVRTAMQEAAVQLNMDTSSLTGQSTVRQILRTFGEQWGFRALKLGMVSL